MKTAEDAITLWELTRAQHHARQELFLGYASELARAGRLETARDVALEAAGHVSLEHASTHFLLGELAVVLDDPQLLAEAKAFLHAQGAEGWEAMLDEVQRSRSPSFRGPTGWA